MDHTFDVASKMLSPYSGSPGLILCHTEPRFKGFFWKTCHKLLCILPDRLENATEKAFCRKILGQEGDAQWGTSWSLRHMNMHEASVPSSFRETASTRFALLSNNMRIPDVPARWRRLLFPICFTFPILALWIFLKVKNLNKHNKEKNKWKTCSFTNTMFVHLTSNIQQTSHQYSPVWLTFLGAVFWKFFCVHLKFANFPADWCGGLLIQVQQPCFLEFKERM